ncbi:MAG: protein kinase [Deltaproteobacteria bacterium]|nr:protein kinase [Deltaproteobacteria bacterium]
MRYATQVVQPEPSQSYGRALARVGSFLRGKWRLDQLLGVGGMAAVYAATHRNGARGAVKLLHRELAISDEARARFLREGYVANRVDHPGAVRVLDDDVAEDGAVFLVMELLEGNSLEAIRISRPSQRFTVQEVVQMTSALLDTLAAAHAKGIIHRDLKPDNVFLTRSGELKILDFGIARLMEQAETAHRTRTGQALGTPAYMPPEQAKGDWDEVDHRTDLWAVGATMFTLLTGRRVHQADTLNKLLLAAMTRPAPGVLTVRDDIPSWLAEVIDRALAFDRENRWWSARDMKQALVVGAPEIACATPSGTILSAQLPADDPGIVAPHVPRVEQVASPVSSDSQAAVRTLPRRTAAKRWTALVALSGVLAGVVMVSALFLRKPELSSAAPSRDTRAEPTPSQFVAPSDSSGSSPALPDPSAVLASASADAPGSSSSQPRIPDNARPPASKVRTAPTSSKGDPLGTW